MPELQRTTMNPPGVSPPQGLYSHVARVKAPELVFIAGQVALDAGGNLVGPGDVGAQTTQVFSNLEQILAKGQPLGTWLSSTYTSLADPRFSHT